MTIINLNITNPINQYKQPPALSTKHGEFSTDIFWF